MSCTKIYSKIYNIPIMMKLNKICNDNLLKWHKTHSVIFYFDLLNLYTAHLTVSDSGLPISLINQYFYNMDSPQLKTIHSLLKLQWCGKKKFMTSCQSLIILSDKRFGVMKEQFWKALLKPNHLHCDRVSHCN